MALERLASEGSSSQEHKSPREGANGCEPRKQEARSIEVLIVFHFIIFLKY